MTENETNPEGMFTPLLVLVLTAVLLLFVFPFMGAPLLIISLILIAPSYSAAYNKIVSFDERVDEEWSNIKVVIESRDRVIEQLFDAAGSAAEHERDTLTRVTELRKKARQAQSPVEQARVDEEVQRFVREISSEDYPEIEAVENFQHIQEKMRNIERDISDKKKDYNRAVSMYNSMVRGIPGMIIAMISGFEERERYTTASEEESYTQLKDPEAV